MDHELPAPRIPVETTVPVEPGPVSWIPEPRRSPENWLD